MKSFIALQFEMYPEGQNLASDSMKLRERCGKLEHVVCMRLVHDR